MWWYCSPTAVKWSSNGWQCSARVAPRERSIPSCLTRSSRSATKFHWCAMSPPRSQHLMRFFLDTNIVSNVIRDPQGRVAERIKIVGEQEICTSIVVAAELRYGAAKKASPPLTAQVEAVLTAIDTVPFDAPADEIYASIGRQLELAGTPIGGNDLIIAAQALILDLTLVSDNDREFARVAGYASKIG